MDDGDTQHWSKIMRILNARLADGSASAFTELAHKAFEELSNVGDYVWKTPNLIDSELTLEKEKLDAYFPITGNTEKDQLAKKLRYQRWAHEGHKLEVQFPRLMATANLFVCLGLFETYCLRLGKLVEKKSQRLIGEAKGQGISKIFNFFKLIGADPRKFDTHQQIESALKIRNCLYHADGLLAWSREEEEIRKIVSNHSFLSVDHRVRFKARERKISEVVILTDDLGDRIAITNSYAHIVVFYLRDFFLELTDQTGSLFSGSDNDH